MHNFVPFCGKKTKPIKANLLDSRLRGNDSAEG
jgi:hypothetical protein